MTQTVNKIAESVKMCDSDSIKDLLQIISQSSLMGARGNSGVILSQIIRGACESLIEAPALTALVISSALKHGVSVAYQSVLKPVEGTMLTVIRGAAESTSMAVDKDPNISPAELMEWASIGARKALESTPELLPVLKEAGVVDAGGYGLVIILESVVAALNKVDTTHIDEIVTGEISKLEQTSELTYGYCTEFVIKTDKVDIRGLEKSLSAIGDSVVVAGAGSIHRVHVHTNEPGKALDIGTVAGSISDIKINNMREEAEQFRTLSATTDTQSSIVAVVQGKGNREILAGLGVKDFVSGGQSMNPSAEEILDALKRTESRKVIVLPNNKNVIMTARQAASLSDKEIEVVETTSIPQGISVLLEYDPQTELKDNAARMRKALSRIKVGELARAVRDSKTNGITVRNDDYIAIIDDKVISADPQIDKTIDVLMINLLMQDPEFITVYLGSEATEPERQVIEDSVKRVASDRQVEIHEGGQPLYHVMISVE